MAYSDSPTRYEPTPLHYDTDGNQVSTPARSESHPDWWYAEMYQSPDSADYVKDENGKLHYIGQNQANNDEIEKKIEPKNEVNDEIETKIDVNQEKSDKIEKKGEWFGRSWEDFAKEKPVLSHFIEVQEREERRLSKPRPKTESEANTDELEANLDEFESKLVENDANSGRGGLNPAPTIVSDTDNNIPPLPETKDEKIARLERENAEKDEKIDHLEKRVGWLSGDCAMYNQQRDRAQEGMNEVERENARLDAQNRRLQRENGRFDAENGRLREELRNERTKHNENNSSTKPKLKKLKK